MRPGLKFWLPRSLYGRAALILLLPVILLQVIVSVAFIQRHYDGVTRQMTLNLVPGIAEVRATINEASDMTQGLRDARALLTAFGLVAEAGGSAGPDSRNFIDLAAGRLIETLRERLPDVLQVDLASNRRIVSLALGTAHGPVTLTFSRRLVTASNPHQLLVIMAFASVLLTLISFIYLRNQLRPVRLLARAAEAFGHGETLNYKPSGSLEVRAAGMAFLEMRDRIERQIEQRTLMLSGVSHDLRTPLTRMKLSLSLMDDPEARAMMRDVDDMERLIDEFIAFARGDQDDDVSLVDLATFLADRTRHANGRLTVDPVPDGATLRARPIALGRALDNLIGNALRYGNRATLSAALGETWITFTVEDDGPGIPEADRERAVRPFVRLDGARNQDKGTGSGLGLAIASDIARRHGGSLRLGTSARMGGLRAEIVLPRQSA